MGRRRGIVLNKVKRLCCVKDGINLLFKLCALRLLIG